MNRDLLDRPDLVREVRLKIPLPIVIPLGALIVIAGTAILFSRILLSVPKGVAVAIALVAALNILGACAVIALRPRISGVSLVELAVVVFYPLLIGVVIASIGAGGGEGAGEAAAAAEGEGAGTSGPSIAAEGVQFNTDTLQLPAGEEFTLTFENKDSVEHNVAIYETDKAEEELFVGEIFAGQDTMEYEVPSLKKGEYYFQCDVHPNMNGDAIVK